MLKIRVTGEEVGKEVAVGVKVRPAPTMDSAASGTISW